MSLKLICGRAGYGKSTYLFKEIKDAVKQKKRVYIVTPEQFSYTAEKKLMEILEEEATITAEVLTFERMAYRILQEWGNVPKVSLSHSGKAMLSYYLVTKQQKNLKFLGKSSENIAMIQTQIAEFKKHCVTVKQLKNTQEKTEDTYLEKKLQDIIILYQEYEQKMQENYRDENDDLTRLAEILEHIDWLKDTYFYFDEFTGFTKQEYEVIRKIMKKANKVSFAITSDENNNKNSELDLFYSSKQTIEKLIQLAKEEKIHIEKTKVLDEPVRFKNNELQHLEKYFNEIPYKIYTKNLSKIKLSVTSNPYTEIEQIAQQIVILVREKGYRYKDISVITKMLDTYANLVKVIFEQYQIPVFIDEKKELSQNPFVKYLLSILEIFIKNWSYESVFQYLKSGFINIDKEELYKLENYCIKWGIKGKKWYEKKWEFRDEQEIGKKQSDRFEELRNQIVSPLQQLKQNLSGKKQVKELTTILYQFLIEQKIDRQLENKIKELEKDGKLEQASEYVVSWGIILDVLDEMVLLFGKENMTFEKYLALLKTGLGNSELGKIPSTQDQVILGDVDRSRSHKTKIAFIIGLNDGIFPSAQKEEGYLNDQDRDKLKKIGITLAKGTLENLYEENYNNYKAFTIAEEYLYLSYPISDKDSKPLRPSIFITRLKKIFPQLKEQLYLKKEEKILTKQSTFEALLNNLREWQNGKELDEEWIFIYHEYKREKEWNNKLNKAIQGWNYQNIPQNLNQKNIESLYGGILKTSVSRLEQYKACPFSYYLKYGLKLSEQSTYKISSINTGSFMHEVIDEFFQQIRVKGKNIKTITEEETENIIDIIINEKLTSAKYYIFQSSAKYRLLTKRLKQVILKSMKYIIDNLKYSDFQVLGTEIEFKKGKEYPPIEILLDNGKRIEITGKIDRIDIAKQENGGYIRIIDYKSSVKNLDLNEIIEGLQIQLLTYIDAVCQKENFIPAGILYESLIEPIIRAEKELDVEQLEEELRKKFKMQGLIVADAKIIKMMDNKLEKGASTRIPVYIDSQGEISQARSSTITRSQFEDLQIYCKNLIKQILKEMLEGNITLKPYYNIKQKKTPCEYCIYKSICQFQSGNCQKSYNYIGKLEKQAILEKIKRKGELK